METAVTMTMSNNAMALCYATLTKTMTITTVKAIECVNTEASVVRQMQSRTTIENDGSRVFRLPRSQVNRTSTKRGRRA